MKKFFKFCGISVLVLIILGFALWGIGAVTVGTDAMNTLVEDLTNNRVHMDLNGIQIDFLEDLEENALYDINDSNMFNNDYQSWKGDVEKTVVADGNVKKLEIEMGGCMFELMDSQDASYYVEYTGKGKTQAYVENNELHVKVLNGNEWNIINWGAGEKDNCLTLYVPIDAVFDEVDVNMGAGQMKLDGLKAKEMEVEIGAGQLLSKGLQAEQLSVSVGAGEAVLEEALLKNVQTEVGAGNCEIEGTITGDIEADCAMGNITFELKGTEMDFNYEIECVTGNIEIGGNEYSGLCQEQSIDNGAAKKIEVECAIGNVEVIFQE